MQQSISASPNKRYAIKVYSELLKEEIWILSDEEMKREINDNLTTYLPNEIEHMKKNKATKDDIKKIHMVKKTFPGSHIISREDLRKVKPERANTICKSATQQSQLKYQ